MQNLYEVIKGSLFFNKFVINNLVCVEYNCPLPDEQVAIFAQYDYIIHVLSGKKTWQTINGKWILEAGETMYVKKGAAVITQDFEDDFCMLGFFIPDSLIRESLADTVLTPGFSDNPQAGFMATKLNESTYLEGFFQSMLTYFRGKKQPPDSLILLKLKELLINIISHCHNPQLISYLHSVAKSTEPSLTDIMENNFCYNLKLEEFAKMSHRSLSTFKRDFFNHYNKTPGKWLKDKRLDYSAKLLLNKSMNISQSAYESGFEDVSHFTRTFKEEFKQTPTEFRSSRA